MIMRISTKHNWFAYIYLALLVLTFHRPAYSQLQQVTIGTNPAGTHSYTVAGAVARVIQDESSIRSIIRPFSGSSAYVPLLHRGEITLGLVTNIDSYLSYSGREPYMAPMSNLRLIARGFPLYMMYMVRGDSDFYRIEDLRNQRVVVNIRANAALGFLHKAILATGGLDEDSVNEITVGGLADGARLLTEGRVDAVSIGVDTALTLQAHSTIGGGIRYVTMGHDESKLAELMPGSKVSPAPKGPTTIGLDNLPRVSEISHYINTGTHLSEDDAYFLTKTIYEQWQGLRDNYSVLSEVNSEEMAPTNPSIPYHEGAIKYYKEIGLWTEEHQNNQAKFLE
ncbi:MAG: hypothetical protein CMM56_02850 [Rhodospirillaceae bacterium]|nr:hypothetical protein [Rhodospirillaceae bacterium]|tara:strand:- start:1306 stop:2319 length:1014 start_codon:yes stop_codon:yes gene_type:complete